MVKIAFSGVFDLKNYGDHLFYILFEKMLESRNIEFSMDLFSPYEFKQDFYETRPVYALSDMEKMHLEKQYDAIIVGGGGIINLLYSQQRIWGEKFEKYSFSDLWAIPCMLAEKYGVKCIWNAPEVPNAFPEAMAETVKCLADEIDYISVRDEKSKNILMECGISGEQIKVVPDTALILNRYFDSVKLKDCVQQLFGFSEKYLVFHSNRWIPEESFAELDKIFADAVRNGYQVIFLPLAYTHADEEILKRVSKQIQTKVILPDKKLDVYEMMAILACTDLYIGVSFHGAVTAMQYGNRAIAYDYMHNKKTKWLFELMEKEPYYVEDAEYLYETYHQIMAETDFRVDNRKNEQEIEEHFNEIIERMKQNVVHKKQQNYIFAMTRAIEQANMGCMEAEKVRKQQEEEIANLQKELKEYHDVSTIYQAKAEDFEQTLKTTQDLLKLVVAEKEDIIKKLEEKVAGLEGNVAKLEQNIRDMEATKIWRFRNRVRKIMGKQ